MAAQHTPTKEEAALAARVAALEEELAAVTDVFARVVGWLRDPQAMESEAEMAELADDAIFWARGFIPGSSSGRTPGFDPGDEGSTPSPGTPALRASGDTHD